MRAFKAKRLLALLNHADVAASLYVALFFVMIVMAQLFTFEDFPGVLTAYDSGMSSGAYQVIASIVVVLEVLAVPYVLGMKLRPAIRRASQFAGGLVLLGWLVAGLYQATTSISIENVGLYGSILSLPQGWWLVSYMLGLLVLFGFVISKDLPTRKRRKA